MDLEIDEDLGSQRRAWAFERAGWAFLLLVLVAAALGLFGNGLLGTARASTVDGSLWLEYPRFLRAGSPERLRLVVDAPRAEDGRLSVWLDAAYFEGVSLERVMPAPERMVAGSERLTLEFEWDGAAGPVAITFEIVANEAGSIRSRIGSDTRAVELRQLVYP